MRSPIGVLMSSSGMRDHGTPEKHEHRIHPLAQEMELQSRYKKSQEPCTIKPGDLCRDRKGMVTIVNDPLLILWRMLDLADEMDRAIVMAFESKQYGDRIDCLVAFLDDDGDLIIMPHESWRLDPVESLTKTKTKQK